MKRVLYLCATMLLVTSFGLAGSRTYAAHPASHSAAKMLSVQICSDMPFGEPSQVGLSKGIWNGAKLAISQWKGKFKKVGLDLGPLIQQDYAKADGSGHDPDKEHANALSCVGKNDTYGMDGTLNSAMAKIAEPILNQAGMAMISPANSGIILTDPKQRSTQEPATANGSIKSVTYFRTVTTDALQGPADAVFFAKTLKAKKVYLVDDGGEYGAGLALAFKNYRNSHHLSFTIVGQARIETTDSAHISTSSDAIADQIVSASPDVVFCGCDGQYGFALPKALRAKGFTKPFMAGDAIDNAGWITAAGSGSVNNYCTDFGPNKVVASKSFRTAYQKMFHIATQGYDATSYDAANIILNAVYQSKTHGKFKGNLLKRRTSILPYILHTKWHGSIGTTTFDKNGDTSNRIISVYHVKGNAWTYFGAAPKTDPKLSPTG
jgi:branched-chain amino acid transport system substrate-binding protein